MAEPAQWQVWNADQRMLHLLSLSIDECLKILNIEISPKDQLMLNVKINVIRAVFMACAKFAQASSRFKANRDDLMRQMAEEFDKGTEK